MLFKLLHFALQEKNKLRNVDKREPGTNISLRSYAKGCDVSILRWRHSGRTDYL